MSFRTEFPDYDRELYIPKGFEDYSWHNDVMPRAAKYYKNGLIGISIWQDYSSKSKREYADEKQFIFSIEVDNEIIYEVRTNSINEIKKLAENVQCI